MESVLINFTNGNTRTFANVDKTIISGDCLIISEKNTYERDGEYSLLITNEVFELKNINNYTTEIKTKKYGDQ